MSAKENVFNGYLNNQIEKHESLLEMAYLNSNKKHIENNRLILEKLKEVRYEFEKTFN